MEAPNATRTWMVRAGERGYLADEFAKGMVAIAWDLGDLSKMTSVENIREAYEAKYPDAHPGRMNNHVAVLDKFRNVIAIGDRIVTYDTQSREYLVGTMRSGYFYRPVILPDGYDHQREVAWQGRTHRDALTLSTRNSLGSTLTLFSINAEVAAELIEKLNHEPVPKPDSGDSSEEFEEAKKTAAEQSHELLKDRIQRLDSQEMEELAAALLRAMGYRARVSRPGKDRGRDVFASPDGLGFEEPRIKVEVKKHKGKMGAQDLRSFLATLRAGDRGLYINTGGFTQEARYEAERFTFPVTLLDLDDLADEIAAWYENFDTDGRLLLPLTKLYWPAE